MSEFRSVVWRVVIGLAMLTCRSEASGIDVLYSFDGGSDGYDPAGGLVRYKHYLYGTTADGGAYSAGTVFKLAPDGTHTVLYAFQGTDGNGPEGTLMADKAGNLYGTTYIGGVNGYGTVFRLAQDGTETALYAFSGPDGANPTAGVIADKKGRLFGTTKHGGSSDQGTVFEVTGQGEEKVLHSFTGGSDGGLPPAELIRDPNHNLYGTTEVGGAHGFGTVFKVGRDGSEQVLYSFSGGTDGGEPLSSLVMDGDGNLYGTTNQDGDAACSCGTVFKLGADGTFSVLHKFKGGSDGAGPWAGLVQDASGNLYGTTSAGGHDYGTIFKVAASGKETVLYALTYGDGAYPYSRLTLDSKNNLYGAASLGGDFNYGSVFTLR